jgi:protein-histidine N-methyltransferase
MAFSFGFSGDDIDMDDSDINNGLPDVLLPKDTANSLPELVKPSKHDINDWVSESQ